MTHAGVAHHSSAEMSFEEAVQRDLENRRLWAAQPANVEYTEAIRWRDEQRRRSKPRKGGKPELIGPPNPYKPHRKA